MKKNFIILMAVFAVSACGHNDKTPIQQCGGYDVQMTMSDDGDMMHANINGDELDLTHVVSASGAKYAGTLNDTSVVLWEKSGVWTMMLDDDQIIDCAAK